MLYIFDSSEKLIDILLEGSFLNAIHREVLNGESTFKFTIPEGREHIIEGNLVAFRDLDSYWQVFEIKRLVDLHGDGLTRTAYCEHIFYELIDDVVVDKRPSADATAAMAGMLENTRWQVGIVDDLGAASTNAYYESVLSGVKKIANAWKGELNWRCVISGGVITRYVDLRAMVGTDTGKQFAYSKDILSIEREVDSSTLVTALYGRGKGVETETGGYGRRLTFADVVADDKPVGQEWVGDTDALTQWGRNGRHRFGVFIDEEETDPNSLLQKTRDELNKRKVPRITYELDVVSLEQLAGYEHEKIRKGDLVRVVDREFTPELVISARVIDIERDILDPSNTRVVLGSFAPTIIEATIDTARRVYDMANRPHNTAWLDGKINVLQNAIESAMSNWYTDENGNLIFEAQDGLSAMKLAGEGLAIANQKYPDGTWNWRTFGTGNGFTADLMNTGILDAGLVQIGHATTFEDGYDPTQIVAGSTVGMGVDADCLGLWHFDGSLNSHKGVAVDSDALFGGGCFGQALSIATGKHLKVPATDMLASAGAINFRAKNLSASANNSVIIDLLDSAGNQGMICGIADDGKLFIEDAKLQFQAVETSQTDFNTGTLINVTATAEGNLELARDGTDFSYEETSQADFNTGTLTDVEATSEGNLELEYTPGGTTYGTDFTGGKTYSADSILDPPSFSANKAFDDYTTTSWASSSAAYPHWIKVDLGSNTTKTARKLRIYKSQLDRLKTFKLQGSNNDSNWTDIYSGVASQTTGWLEYTFDNSTAYRYYRIYGTDSYSDAFMQIGEIELMEATETQGAYTASGTRIKEVDISGANPAGGTKIEWSKTTPANTAVKVETALSTDGGSTYGSYSEATSGGSIPGITSATDLSNARLKIRETLSTTDTSKTPQLHSLNLYIYVPYKSSGYRYKIYDISAVGEVGSSEISWSKTTPTDTTLTVKAAISTDGGDNYGSFQTCANGSAIPGLTQGMDISNTRLKVQEDLATSDGTKTPQLQSLTIEVGGDTQKVYGPNKSTLTAWDSISLAYKSDRLSLVVNDSEACFIENPGLPTAFGSYLFIGTDRNGANAINTLVDELRIDKVYRDVAIRTGWHKTGVPFYTSEDMKQWPGYLRAETDGLKVYDSSNALRVLVGSWLKDAIRQYGMKVIAGLFMSGDGPNRMEFNEEGLVGFYNNVARIKLAATQIGYIQFFASDGKYSGYIGADDTNIGLYGLTPNKDLGIALVPGAGKRVDVGGNLHVSGNITKGGSVSYVEPTLNYGSRLLYIVETPELLYYDRGVTYLTNGEAVVKLDPIFLECIEPDTELTPWQVWVECYGDNSVYIADVGEDYFVVKERNGGASNNKVIWRLEATRKNYAGIRLMEVVD